MCESEKMEHDGRLYCNASSDTALCWPRTPADHLAVLACPDIAGIDPTKNATKFCQENGTWAAKADYSACFIITKADHNLDHIGELQTDYIARIIYNLGFTISTIALAVALFIFIYFRSLRCLRNVIHCHLIVTFILRNVIWITMQHSLIPIATSKQMWACKLEVTLFNYAQMTNFFWMLVEGLYLHIIIVWTYSADKIRKWYFVVIGWVLPAPIIAVWAGLRLHTEVPNDNPAMNELIECWLPRYTTAMSHMDMLDYVYIAPTLLVLAINILFLATIISVLVTKLRASSSVETRQLRKAVKATLLLLPLLGITYVLFIWPISDAAAFVEAHNVINAFLQSFQGFFVALFYCFLNGEVKSVLKKKISIFNDNRTLATRCTKTSIAWTNDIGLRKESVAMIHSRSTLSNCKQTGNRSFQSLKSLDIEETQKML